MKAYESLFNANNYGDSKNCELIQGNSIDMNIQKGDCEVRADIVVSKVDSVRVWGQIHDCDGMPIPAALVKLIKPTNINGAVEYEGIAHTITDCNGFYQIDIQGFDGDCKYKILVSKASVGNERKIASGNCSPCEPIKPNCNQVQQGTMSSNQQKTVYQNVEQQKPVYQNVEQQKPVYQNVEQQKPVYQNVEQQKPVYQNIEQQKPVYQNIEQQKPIYQNIEQQKSVYQNIEQQKPTYQNNNQVKPSFKSNNQVKPVYRNNEPKSIYQGSDQVQQSAFQTNENIDNLGGYSSEQINNSFYGEPLNKSNIFKKNE